MSACTCRPSSEGLVHDPDCPVHPIAPGMQQQLSQESLAFVELDDRASRRGAHAAGWRSGRAHAIEQAFGNLVESTRTATRALELLAVKLKPWRGKLDDEDELDDSDAIVKRYQSCALRIWSLFKVDPLPSDHPAQGWLDRIEALLDADYLAPADGHARDDAERKLLRAWAHDCEVNAKTYRQQAEGHATPHGTSSKGHHATGAAEVLERLAKRMRVEAERELEAHEIDDEGNPKP